MSLLGMELI
jgi:hypothetical protein